MTPLEARTALAAFKQEISGLVGGTCSVSVFLSDWNQGALYASVQLPTNVKEIAVGGTDTVSAKADTFEELIEQLRLHWADFHENYSGRMERRMALAVIKLTLDFGQCTDAALRSLGFSVEQIMRFGDKAVADANEMAANGPFAIVAAGKANAA